jgi:hypothetical protein
MSAAAAAAPGLWVAATVSASHLGVDIAPSALAHVHDRARRAGIADRMRIAGGAFDDLPWLTAARTR